MLGKNLPLYPNDNIEMGERGTKQCIRKRLMCVRANNFGKDCSYAISYKMRDMSAWVLEGDDF